MTDPEIEVVETDLGEYIVQLAGDRPSHIVAPIIHLTRKQVGQVMHERLQTPMTDDPARLGRYARERLRQVFLDADMGITGAMKLAHICEGLGLDCQYHACGPAHRAVMAATRNTHFYEMALVGPGMPNIVPPVYSCGYSDQPQDLPRDGRVPVPTGPGLGVTYDWSVIERGRVQHHVFGKA